MRGDTILVSVMHTNNEIGSLQPVAEAGALIKRMNPVCITDTRMVSPRMAPCRSSREILPLESTGRYVTRYPTVSSQAGGQGE